MKIFILAGGQGNRLWPLSTATRPKQFLQLGYEDSLIRKTVKRFLLYFSLEEIYVVTNASSITKLKEDLEGVILEQNILVEPQSRNTAMAATWATTLLLKEQRLENEEPIIIAPCDHSFSNDTLLIETLLKGLSFSNGNNIITFGVSPSSPKTQYGYIKQGPSLEDSIYKVEAFVEKPPKAVAERYFQETGWLWNIGIYILTPSTLFKELSLYAPTILSSINTSSSYTYPSIDQAIMEKTSSLIVIELKGMTWYDIGSWEGVYAYHPKDAFGNVVIGPVQKLFTRNSLIITDKEELSLNYGENLIVIETNNHFYISNLTS